MRRMHIVFCIASLGPGGAERVLSDLANHYAERGGTVTIITLVSADARPFYPLNPGIQLIQTNKSSKGRPSFFKRCYNISSSLWGLRKTIKRLQPDRVISFIDLMNVRVLLSCLGLRVPVIVSERTDPRHHQFPLKKLSSWLRLKLYPSAYRVVVQTQAAADYFPKSWKEERISIIPNAVKKPECTKNLSGGKIKIIITVGRLSAEKNHHDLIGAFAEWSKVYPDLTLKIYGEGPLRSALEKQVNNLSLQGKVHLPGSIPHIQTALLESDLFVFPSRYEGFPNALCEAMALGLPVVASDCSGNREVIREGVDGRLFPVGKTDILSKIVLELMQDTEQCQRLADNARAIVNRFGSKQVYKNWDTLIFL
jgi:glycosyltransferase involved in cell wall biosynthesis